MKIKLLAIPVLTSLLLTGCFQDSHKPYFDEQGVKYVDNVLHNFVCKTDTSCYSKTNKYIIHIDGIFVEPSEEFTQKCRSMIEPSENGEVVKRDASVVTMKYCNKMVYPGVMQEFTSSAQAINHLIEFDKNPMPDDYFDTRVEKAKFKIDTSLGIPTN